MGIFDKFTTCTKPFNEGYDWELAKPPLPLPGFEWLGGESQLGWTAGACREWMHRMWAVKSGSTILHSGDYLRHPTTGEIFWTYFGAPDGSKVGDPAATPFVEAAEAYGFVFVGRLPQPEPDPDPDKPDPPTPTKKPRWPWIVGGLAVAALAVVMVKKGKKGRK